MSKYLAFLWLFPFAALSQTATIKSFYLIHSNDTIKTVSYPLIYNHTGAPYSSLNNAIKALVFHSDTSGSLQKLLRKLYKKDNSLKIRYTVNRNKTGLLSLVIHIISSKGDLKGPIYLNFDLNTGSSIKLSELFKSKNDSFSFRQAVVPCVTDSVRLFEQGIDKSNPNYGKIIEWLNTALNNFWNNYPSEYIITDKNIIVCFDCFIPHKLRPYDHTYRLTFPFKTIKNIFKPEMMERLMN